MNYFSLNVRLQNQSMKTNSAEGAFLPQSQIVYKATTKLFFVRLVIAKLRLVIIFNTFKYTNFNSIFYIKQVVIIERTIG